MANPLRRLLRAFGRDLADYPPRGPHWRSLIRLLDSTGVDVVLDVGGNVGQYGRTLRAAGFRGRIVSFEPQSVAHAALEAAAARDRGWTVAPRMALAERAGEVTLNVSNESDMSSILPLTEGFLAVSPTSRTVATETAPAVRLDDVASEYLAPHDRPFLKLDTQGYERQVLAGGPDTLARAVGLQIELSLVPLYRGETLWREMVDWLMGQGFAPRLFVPGYYSRHMGRMLQFDAVFLRG